ncbi:MAG: type IV pilus modification protein PilV [Nitrospiraceae bacterium]
MGSRLGQRQAGFSLLEVIISVVVLSIGLLGLAAMQEIATSRNVGANDLTVATNLSREMIERVQYSKKQVSFYNGIDVSSSTNNCPSGGSVPLMVTGDCTQWRTRLLASNLTNIRGTVTVTNTGPTTMMQRQVMVQLSWKGHLTPMTFSTIITLG